VREVLNRLKTVYLPVENDDFLMNVNTPGEWAAVAPGKE
jgi:molybdopterin-guanine dinucleotide biosynthesis protein A